MRLNTILKYGNSIYSYIGCFISILYYFERRIYFCNKKVYFFIVVNRTFGSVRQQPCCRTVRFGSVRPIFSDFYLIVRFGLPNSSAKFWPNSSVRFGSAEFEIGKVRFGSVRRKNSEFGSPLILLQIT